MSATVEQREHRIVYSTPPRAAIEAAGRCVTQRWITGLSLLISVLALVATTVGISSSNGVRHASFTSLRGETISIQGGGVYAHESVSGAAQAIGQDYATLIIGIPLLLIATYLAARGSLRGRLLQAGALWYFGYTYLLMAFGGAYNQLFLAYVALYSASVFAFVLALHAIDIGGLPARFSPRFARRTIAWLVIGFGAVLALLWLGRIVPSLLSGTTPVGLESYDTLFVQAGDLGLVVPLAILAGVLLLQSQPVGYLLAGVLLVKGATLGLALMVMVLSMAAAGVAIVPVEVAFFVTVALICCAGTIHLVSVLPGRSLELATMLK
jgi:hypothetical protein